MPLRVESYAQKKIEFQYVIWMFDMEAISPEIANELT